MAGEATGTAKYVADFSELYGDGAEKTGHFFPIQFDPKYSGKKITIGGRSDGDKDVTLDEDLLLIIRLENLSANKVTLTPESEPFLTVDFTKVTQSPMA